jgi:hypothetical protein
MFTAYRCKYEEESRGLEAEAETEAEAEDGAKTGGEPERQWCIYRDMECDPDSCLWYEDGICDGGGPVGPWRLRAWRR